MPKTKNYFHKKGKRYTNEKTDSNYYSGNDDGGDVEQLRSAVQYADDRRKS